MYRKIKELLKDHKTNLVLFLIVVTVLVGFAWIRLGGSRVPTPSDVVNVARESVENTGKQLSSVLGGEFNINEEKFSIDPSKLVGGGPPKDGIPSIDDPKFETAKEAWSWLKSDDIVFGLVFGGESRAYPQRVLVWHEIVNDTVGEDPILVTYCPLCQTSIGFERKVDGVVVEFGVSGKLFNSNLVMYNRTNDRVKTESLWTQIGGEAIVGDFTGKKLKKITLDTVRWKDWVEKHPETKVLSRDTGFARNYNSDPYGDYYTRKGVIAPLENEDDRLFEKAIIFGIEINGKAKAYPEEELEKTPSFTDEFAGKKLQITRNSDGSVRIRNTTDGGEIVPEIGFWFSWVAFHPDTELYSAG